KPCPARGLRGRAHWIPADAEELIATFRRVGKGAKMAVRRSPQSARLCPRGEAPLTRGQNLSPAPTGDRARPVPTGDGTAGDFDHPTVNSPGRRIFRRSPGTST